MSFNCRTSFAAALCLVTLVGCNKAPVEQQVSLEVPATVNGAPITRAEVDRAAKALLAQSNLAAPIAPEAMEKTAKAAVDQLIGAELLHQAAEKVEVKDLERQVAEKMAQTKSGYPSQFEFEKALKSAHLTLKELEVALRKDVIINNMIEKQFVPQAVVSGSEIRKFYDENKEKAFRQGERVRISQILVPVSEKAGPEVRRQARDRTLALLKRVREGEDFAALANAESAPPTNKNGGNMGILGKGDTVSSFERAAFALKAGEVSGLVETPVGYHIIKLYERLPAGTAVFAEVESWIAAHLKQEKVRKAVNDYVTQLRAKAKIEKV